MSTDEAAETPRFKFRFFPVLTAVALGIGIPYLAGEILSQLRHYSRLVPGIADHLGWLYAQHGLQMLLALVAIAVMKRLVPANYGLHTPPGKTYVLPAILWGLCFGVLMTVVDYAPSILSHTAPKLGYPLTTGNVLGWLGFAGIYVGPTEEILFRSLLVTYLSTTMPGRARLWGFEMNAAGLVAAAIYALYATGFLSQSVVGRPGTIAGPVRARRALRLLAGEIEERPGADRRPQCQRRDRICAAVPHGCVLGMSANASASNS